MVTLDFAACAKQTFLSVAFIGMVALQWPSLCEAVGPSREEAASLFDLESNGKDQSGKQFRWDDRKFEWTVLSMVYTSCHSSCPLITQEMQVIEKKLTPGSKKKVRFVLFSFDPENDTPKALLDFALKHQLNLANWFLVSSSSSEARTLATAIDFKYKKLANGDFSHSNNIFLLNHAGRVTAQADLSKASALILEKM